MGTNEKVIGPGGRVLALPPRAPALKLWPIPSDLKDQG